MTVGGELRREIVKYVSRISASGEKDDRPARATPIEYFQLNVLIDSYKARRVKGWVLPGSGLLWISRSYKRSEQDKG